MKASLSSYQPIACCLVYSASVAGFGPYWFPTTELGSGTRTRLSVGNEYRHGQAHQRAVQSFHSLGNPELRMALCSDDVHHTMEDRLARF
ncbi:unnamed protein product [Protopolystoma xenopodis]|uniref:Uncharacterized protein n=1 Tax=Protopolystoma xenopodis TaxID=117903 RepID=A0A3S5CM43_9PLAT|nr:unnamed protein product [Protopolystoma xenopodis]